MFFFKNIYINSQLNPLTLYGFVLLANPVTSLSAYWCDCIKCFSSSIVLEVFSRLIALSARNWSTVVLKASTLFIFNYVIYYTLASIIIDFFIQNLKALKSATQLNIISNNIEKPLFIIVIISVSKIPW